MNSYLNFIREKQYSIKPSGFECGELNPLLFDWQADIDRWALRKGKCALFEECGLGKTPQQLVFGDEVYKHTDGNVLILAPLAVSDQTVREGRKFNIHVNIAKSQSDVRPGINISNYERLDKFKIEEFSGVILDESSILKHTSSSIRAELTDACRNTPYKLEATATPSPNDYTEIGNHAEWLGVMTQKEMLSTFFVHDGDTTQKWRLKGHAKRKFFEWVASWACCLRSPADLGYAQIGYDLPPLNVYEHIIEGGRMADKDGQLLFVADAVKQSLNDRRKARRDSIEGRTDRAAKLAATDEQVMIWCDLNDESCMLAEKIADAIEVRGSDTPEHKTNSMLGFASGDVRCLISKPSIAGFGMNWQNCHNVIFAGLSDSFEAYYQAVRRFWRFGQNEPVNVHIITSENEGAVKANVERKQRECEGLMNELVLHTKDILKQDVRGTRRLSEEYNADKEIMIPKWLRSA